MRAETRPEWRLTGFGWLCLLWLAFFGVTILLPFALGSCEIQTGSLTEVKR